MQCNQCVALVINGVFCHEQGCPNTSAVYDKETEEWIKMRECPECGCTVPEGSPCCDDDDSEGDSFGCDGYGCLGCRECSDHDDTPSLNPHGPWGEA